MCITTADVNKIICLFYQRVYDFIGNNSYGVECDQDALTTEIKKLLKYYEFNCYYSDFIREYVADNESDLDLCTRYSSSEGVPN